MRGVGIRPLKRRGLVIVVTNVGDDLASEVRDRCEDAAGDHVAFDLREPEFHLIEPRAIGRGEMQMDAGMASEEGRDQLGLVRREVIEDEVDVPWAAVAANDGLEKRDEFITGVARHCHARDVARLRIERRVERECPVAGVLEAVAFRAAGGERKDRIESIQGLKTGLFVQTEHGGMARRMEIQADDVSRFPFKVRVGGPDIAFQSMRLQASTPPRDTLALRGAQYADGPHHGRDSASPHQ